MKSVKILSGAPEKYQCPELPGFCSQFEAAKRKQNGFLLRLCGKKMRAKARQGRAFRLFRGALLVIAVFAAGGMILSGCDSPAGAGSGDEAVSEDICAPVTGSASGTTAGSAAGTKKIKVKFEVGNGGLGLYKSAGIVSTQDDSYLVYDSNIFSWDFTITITVPANDEYLNIRWKGFEGLRLHTFVKAKMKAESGTITLKYNGYKKVVTNNLYDVRIDGWDGHRPVEAIPLANDWKKAKKRSASD